MVARDTGYAAVWGFMSKVDSVVEQSPKKHEPQVQLLPFDMTFSSSFLYF